jgi:hypothetical protein
VADLLNTHELEFGARAEVEEKLEAIATAAGSARKPGPLDDTPPARLRSRVPWLDAVRKRTAGSPFRLFAQASVTNRNSRNGNFGTRLNTARREADLHRESREFRRIDQRRSWMKIILRLLGALCLVWAVGAAIVPCRPTERAWGGAMKESWDVIMTNGNPSDGVYKDKVVPVRVGMLAELHDRAEQPIVYGNVAQIFLWASGVFAGVSGVSLIVLSKGAKSLQRKASGVERAE